jgi:large subunit ribosomal protein L6
MVEGVANGYKLSLDFRGVGYRAEFKDRQLKMTVGLSHQPVLDIPAAVDIRIETIDEAGTKFPRVHLESPDKQLIGRVAARIRQTRPPEPYNGKGVRYTGERIREKAGKAGKAGG